MQVRSFSLTKQVDKGAYYSASNVPCAPVCTFGAGGQRPAHSPDDNSSVRGVILGSSLGQDSGARQSVSRQGESREGSVQQKQPNSRSSPGASLGYLPPEGQLAMGLREPTARMQQQVQEQQQEQRQQQGTEDQAGPSCAPSSHRLSDPPDAQAGRPPAQQGEPSRTGPPIWGKFIPWQPCYWLKAFVVEHAVVGHTCACKSR